MSGSANFTDTDVHRNLNNVFVFHNANICKQYRAELQQPAEGRFGRGLRGDEPKTTTSGVLVLFAPDHTPGLEFMRLRHKVRTNRNMWFAIFTFAESSGVDDTMLALARGGVKIRSVLDPAQVKLGWPAPNWLKHATSSYGCKTPRPARQPAQGPTQAKGHLHNGSSSPGASNYTNPPRPSTTRTLCIIGSPHAEAAGIVVAADPLGDIAVHMRAKVERVVNLGEQFVPA